PCNNAHGWSTGRGRRRRLSRAPLSDPEFSRAHERPIELQVAISHALHTKALLKGLPNPVRIEEVRPGDRARRSLDAIDQKSCYAVVDDLRHRAAGPSDDRRPAGHRLYHYEAKRLRPVDRKQQRPRTAEEGRFLIFPDLTHELDIRIVQQGTDLLIEIIGIGVIDFGRNLQRHPSPQRDSDCTIHSLFWRNAAEEGQIAPLPITGGRYVQAPRKPM